MKAIRKLTRHAVVYGFMPLFNGLGSRFYLSHRPNAAERVDPKLFRQLVRAWEVGRGANNRGDWTRLYFLISTAEDIQQRAVPGAVAELGVYRGASAKTLRLLMPDRPMYLFDTFEGFVERDLPKGVRKGLFSCPLDAVRAFVGDDPDIAYCEGCFPDTAPMVPDDERFALVHLDMDLYIPTKAALEFFWPRLSPGGVMILHDHHAPTWPGIKHAADEFFADKPERPVRIPDKSGTSAVIKSCPVPPRTQRPVAQASRVLETQPQR